jgi:hypothetical protein
MLKFLRRMVSVGCLKLFEGLKWHLPVVGRNPCYWRSRLLWAAMSESERQGARVNICMEIGPGKVPRGHMWITKGEAVIGEKPTLLKARLELMGSRDEHDFWAIIPDPERKG